ncbi:MAG: sulfotransferase domain-containing protein [Pseudomonadota bacterium]
MPRKVYQGALTDSTRWSRVPLRADDVLVVNPPKCGTTWMQTIVALLLSGDPEVETQVATRMPWVDIRLRDLDEVAARLAAMTHRRSFKSHTPLDGVPVQDGTLYLCVFRHPLDAHLSMRRHLANLPEAMRGDWRPEDDASGLTFTRFLSGSADGPDCDSMPLAHIVQHYRAARAEAHRPNVSLFHYADMCRDLPGAMARVARLLGMTNPPALMAALTGAAGFEHMRANAARYAPGGGQGFYRSDEAFFDSGSSGKWHTELSPEDVAAYDRIMEAALPEADRAWLENGGDVPG